MQELTKIIESQQKGHKDDDVFMVGEQLKDMVKDNPVAIDLLKRDLQVEGMDLKGAAKALKDYADKNHGNSKCFCITPAKADSILREFYCFPENHHSSVSPKSASIGFIDLESFL